MKKIFITFLILLIFISCKKELPENIKSAVKNYEVYVQSSTEFDSIILNMSKSDIDKLSLDSIKSIKGDYEFKEKFLNSSKSELDELLKYNPEYSDYDEVKNIKEPYSYKDMRKYGNNILSIDERYYDLMRLEGLK